MEATVAAKGANWEPQLPDGKAFMRWITACPLVASFECGFLPGAGLQEEARVKSSV